MKRPVRNRSAVLGCLFVLLSGCQSPLNDDRSTLLRDIVDRAIERELADYPAVPAPRHTTRPPSEVEQALADRREELDALGPRYGPQHPPLQLGRDLLGRDQQKVVLNLQEAIAATVQHNLHVQYAMLQPAINEADVIRAEAAFDAVFFSSVDFTRQDEPAIVPVIGGQPLGSPVQESKRWAFDTGVRRPLTSGAQVEVGTTLTRSRNLSPQIDLLPDPAYASTVGLTLTQPLLRGFGADVNLASIRLSRNMERRSVEDLRRELLERIAETEHAYWDLVLAWQSLSILEWLTEEGVAVRDVLELRLDFDVRQAQYADAVSVVEQRRANEIRARHRVRQASDRLKQLMNDPRVPVGSEALLQPIDRAIESAVTYDLTDALRTAIAERPVVHQAILRIDDATIAQMLAENARLPMLNVRGQIVYHGLDDGAGSSYSDLASGDFITYMMGLALEIPIGNREAEAGYRQARLRRSAAVIGYQQAIQQVVLDVKSAMRDVVTNYELIGATRSFRIAQAENLRALLIEEEVLAALTPEFLNLKFQRQERLATATQQEAESLVNYNKALASLYRAMGTSLKMNRISIDFVDLDSLD